MDRADRVKERALEIIVASFDRPRLVPKLIDQAISRDRVLGSRDRREALRLIHQSMRWRRRLWGEIPPSAIDLDKLSQSIAEAENLVRAPRFVAWSKMPVDALARELSFPTWLLEQWIADQGLEPAVTLALALNEPAPTGLRANTLKTDRETLAADLRAEGVETQPTAHSPWGLTLETRFNVFSAKAFQKGGCEVQDEASQLAVLLADPQPGQLVVDACARTGGKTLALAALMENRGRIVACDVDSRVFEELDRRAVRAGVRIVEKQWIAKDDPQPLPKLRGAADLVFVDAPCSGLGVLRRKSWMKWAMDASILRAMQKDQIEILARYSAAVKPGGRLLYAVCTINSLENEKVLRAFAERTRDAFTVETTRTFRPDVDRTDGFFAAVLVRG